MDTDGKFEHNVASRTPLPDQSQPISKNPDTQNKNKRLSDALRRNLARRKVEKA